MRNRIWRIVRTIPRVIILFPLFVLVKLGEVADATFEKISPYLPGYDR